MLIRSCWWMVLLVSSISLQIFCLVLAMVERIVLKYLTMVMDLFILSVLAGFFVVSIDYFRTVLDLRKCIYIESLASNHFSLLLISYIVIVCLLQLIEPTMVHHRSPKSVVDSDYYFFFLVFT